MKFKKKPRYVPADTEVEVTTEFYGYRPDSPTLWSTISLQELVLRVDMSQSTEGERHIALATKKSDQIVMTAVDNCRAEHPEKFTRDTWNMIETARATRMNTFDGHNFHCYV